MNVQKLTNKLQDIGHNGHAQDSVYVKVLDAMYKIKGVHQEVIKKEDKDINVFFIDTEI